MSLYPNTYYLKPCGMCFKSSTNQKLKATRSGPSTFMWCVPHGPIKHYVHWIISKGKCWPLDGGKMTSGWEGLLEGKVLTHSFKVLWDHWIEGVRSNMREDFRGKTKWCHLISHALPGTIPSSCVKTERLLCQLKEGRWDAWGKLFPSSLIHN